MDKMDMATQINIQTALLSLFSFTHMKCFKPLPMVTFRGKLTSNEWMHLTDQTLMKRACFFFSTESIVLNIDRAGFL